MYETRFYRFLIKNRVFFDFSSFSFLKSAKRQRISHINFHVFKGKMTFSRRKKPIFFTYFAGSFLAFFWVAAKFRFLGRFFDVLGHFFEGEIFWLFSTFFWFFFIKILFFFVFWKFFFIFWKFFLFFKIFFKNFLFFYFFS